MTYAMTDDQLSFKQSAIDFAKQALNDSAGEREKKGEFYEEGWKKCAAYGMQGLPMPELYGGLGADLMTCLGVMEGMGYGCRDSGLVFALNAHIWTCEFPILKFGTEEQKNKYLPSLIDGSLKGGHAITEPDSGSDAFSIKCRAEKKGSHYVLNGAKTFITNAPIADILLVFAVTDPKKKFAGISAFIVEKNTPGFSVSKPFEMMGLRTCPIGEVILKDCEVPEENMLGTEGSGAAIFNSEMEWERSCLFATHLGAMERDFEQCVEHAKARRQFGQPIGKYQGVSHKIAEMKVRLDLSRMLLYHVATLKAEGKRAPMESAMVKLFISESFVQNSMDAIQIHGAYGYSAELGFEQNLRDAVGGKIYSGTSEIQKNIIATFLGL